MPVTEQGDRSGRLKSARNKVKDLLRSRSCEVKMTKESLWVSKSTEMMADSKWTGIS